MKSDSTLPETQPSRWRRGPLPPGTWMWGAVITHAMLASGRSINHFQFADFRGDHVIVFRYEVDKRSLVTIEQRIEPHEVAYYNNAIDLPIPLSIRQ